MNTSEFNHFRTSPVSRAIVLLHLLFLTGACAPESAAPVVQDLVKINAPTFNDKTNALLSTPTISYNLVGQCDSRAYLTEYSMDGSTWTIVDCTDGKFQIPVKVTGFVQLWARSRGKFSYTGTSIATVRFLLPPTSTSLVAASSSKASNSDKIGRGTQNILASTFEGNTLSSATRRVHTNLPRMVYEE